MRKPLAVAIAGLAAAAPLGAQEQPAQERVHVVRPGETLWDIARMYLSDPFMWPEIFRLNTDVVEDPALIYPTERLVLPGRAEAVAVEQPGGFRREERADRTVRRATSVPYPAISPGDFYRAAFVAQDAEIAPIGRLREVISPTVLPVVSQPGVLPYDKVFVSVTAPVQLGDRIHFIRADRDLRPAGRVWIATGMGTVAAVEDGVATVVVTVLYNEMRVGDLALPAAQFPVRAGVRAVAVRDLQARVLGFALDHPVQAREEIAFLDMGRAAGVREGDEFDVYLPRTERDWGTRPEIPVGRLRVVKVMERTASARIVSLQQPAIAVGLPVRRVARMP